MLKIEYDESIEKLRLILLAFFFSYYKYNAR